MSFLPPFNLQKWVAEHRDELKPPVGNRSLWNEGGFLVMVVGGPNSRTDYHINPAEELFYQIEGDIVLRLFVDGKPTDVPISEGEIFLLPPRVPHSPQRPAGTAGLVVEYPSAVNEDHHLRWYCPKCHEVIHDDAFRTKDLGAQIKVSLAAFAADANPPHVQGLWHGTRRKELTTKHTNHTKIEAWRPWRRSPSH